MNTEEFIKKANIKHNNKYNYSKTIYNLSRIKVYIICPIHGEFWQTPNDHLSGYGCPECGKVSKKKYTLDIFKKKAQEIYGNRRSKRKTEKLIKELEKENDEVKKEVVKIDDTSTSDNSKE